MKRHNDEAEHLLKQELGRIACPCEGIGTGKIAKSQMLIKLQGETFRARNVARGVPYLVTPTAGEPFVAEVKGRLEWALERLREAGAKGCTPMAEPGPRWSAYVHDLRELGIEIETIREAHGEPFAGHHGRYVLRSMVRRAAR